MQNTQLKFINTLSLLFFFLLLNFHAKAQVPAARYSLMTRGAGEINWMGGNGAGPIWTDLNIRNQAKSFKSKGYRHVRINIHTDKIMINNNPTSINVENVNRLKQIVSIALEEGLAVIVDPLHLGNLPNSTNVSNFESFWRNFGALVSSLDPERVFFEVPMNLAVTPHHGT